MRRASLAHGARSRTRVLTPWVAVTLVLSCSPESTEHVSWTPLTEEEVQLRLSSPTAQLPEVLDAQVLGPLSARLPALIETARVVSRVAQVVVQVAETDYSEQEQALPDVSLAPLTTADHQWGTSLYLRVACPGPDPAAPVTDFSAGEARLDSALLTSLDLEPLLQGGEFLVSFSECTSGPLRLDGAFPGRYMIDPARLKHYGAPGAPPAAALALSADWIDYQGSASPVGLLTVGCGGERRCLEDLRVAAELKTASGSFIVGFQIQKDYWEGRQELSLTLDWAGGSTACTYSHGPGYAGASLGCD